MREVALFVALTTLFVLLLHDCLSQDIEVRLVGGQTEHDQVCVCPVDAVGCVSIVVLLGALRTNEV